MMELLPVESLQQWNAYELQRVVWGNRHGSRNFYQWMQGFVFSPEEPTALIQTAKSTSAVLAAVQANIVMKIIYLGKGLQRARAASNEEVNMLLLDAMVSLFNLVKSSQDFFVIVDNINDGKRPPLDPIGGSEASSSHIGCASSLATSIRKDLAGPSGEPGVTGCTQNKEPAQACKSSPKNQPGNFQDELKRHLQTQPIAACSGTKGSKGFVRTNQTFLFSLEEETNPTAPKQPQTANLPVPNSMNLMKRHDFHKKLCCICCKTHGELLRALTQYMAQFQGEFGVVLFLYSLVFTKGLDLLRKDMRDLKSLVSVSTGSGSEALINFLTTGNVNPVGMEHEPYVSIGYLSLREHMEGQQVQAFLKHPCLPIWILSSGTDFSLIFSEKLGLVNEASSGQRKTSNKSMKLTQEEKYEVFHHNSYPGANVGGQVVYVAGTLDLQGMRGKKYFIGKCQIRDCLQTRWAEAHIQWKRLICPTLDGADASQEKP